jgi:hypothetical protein
VFISSASGALLPYRSAAVAVCRRLGMFCQRWDLARANRLLDRLGVAPPHLPTRDMTTWQAPLEPEIRRIIARTRQRQGR